MADQLHRGLIPDTDASAKSRRIARRPGFIVKRVYQIPGRLVTAGKQVLAVRVSDHFGGGGFCGVSTDMRLRSTAEQTPLYHADWRSEFDLGDDPYRFKRW